MITEFTQIQFTEMLNAVLTEARIVLDSVHEIDPINGMEFFDDDIDITVEGITFNGEETWGCSTDYYHFEIPLNVLFNEDATKELLKQRAHRKQITSDAMCEREKKLKLKQYDRDMAQYKQLKNKLFD